MRHQKKFIKMNRDQDHKESLQRNMVTQLFLHEKIKTTEKKADFIIPKVERILRSSQKYDTMSSIRMLKKTLTSELACRKVLEVYKDRYKDKKSGFVRKTKLGFRKGDNASMILLELI